MKSRVKQIVRNAIRKRGFDLVRGPHLHTFLWSRNVDLVLDVGANDGGYARYLRRWGYTGEIVSFEPTRDAFASLERNARGDRYWRVMKLAAGAEPGTAIINVSQDSRFSSFQKLSPLAERFDPAARIVETETVDVVTLDDWTSELPRKSIFLKIDTQGFERSILEGSGELLQRCVGVQLELPIEQLYEGVWSFGEALAYMEARGMTVAQMTPTNPCHHDPASVIEFDCVFRRAA